MLLNLCHYPLRNTNPSTYLVDYVTQSASEGLVNHANFCNTLNVPNSFETVMERDDNLKWKYAMEEEIKSSEKNNMYCYEIIRGQEVSGRKLGLYN